MSDAIATQTQDQDALAFIQNPSPEVLQEVLGQGNLAKLNPSQKLEFLAAVCRSIGLNPLTRPFDIMTLQGKVVVYAKKDCTEQLRKINNVSVSISSQEAANDVLVVTARATLPSGRFDEDIGAVSIKGLTGDALSNARMKAITKAKRRVTLSICGLGFLDESELPEHQGPSQDQPKSRPIATYPEKPKAPEGDVVEAEAVDVQHWSELLPNGWREVKIQVGPFKGQAIGRMDKDAREWAGSNLTDATIDGKALAASRWIYIDRMLASMNMSAADLEVILAENKIIEDDQRIFDLGGDRLPELFNAVRDLQKTRAQ
mgnify:FL=1